MSMDKIAYEESMCPDEGPGHLSEAVLSHL